MLLRALPVVLISWALVGCAPDEEEDSKAPPINEGGDTAVTVCEGTAPVLTELVISNGGIQDFEGEDSPSMVVAATGTDADSDLHRMDLRLWWDDVVDGAVDTSATGTAAGYYAMDPDPCATAEATYGIVFEVDNNRFLFGTAYEFAAVIYDDAGLESAMFIDDGIAPNEDGSDG
jgi:hypothetical protein